MRLYLLPLVLLFCCSAKVSAQYVVTSVSDLPDADLTDNIYSPATLRSAIQNANNKGLAATISISPVIEKQSIKLSSSLPPVTFPLTFEGKGITLEPSSGSSATNGFFVSANNCKISNFMIQGFNGAGLVWQGNDGVVEKMVIRYCKVGINCNGAKRNKFGGELMGYYSNYIYGMTGTGGSGISLILDSDANTIQFCSIGLNEQGDVVSNSRYGIYCESRLTVIKSNVISGNEYGGIQISGNSSTGSPSPLQTTIMSNLIGTDQFGGSARPNMQQGISLMQTSLDVIENNTVSGNGGGGILIADAMSEKITIRGNRVGTDRLVKKAIPNGSGIGVSGKNHLVIKNIVSGNLQTGINNGSEGTIFEGNIIGLDSSQSVILGNGGRGFTSITGPGEIIGDETLLSPNVVAGNGSDGVHLLGALQSGGTVVGFIIGTNEDLTLYAPNGGHGIRVTHSISNLEIRDNYISNSGGNAIQIERNVVIFLDARPPIYQRPSNIRIFDNVIGWSAKADSAGLISGSGIYVLNADSIFISRNHISSCSMDGIRIANDSTRIVRIHENDIGRLPHQSDSLMIRESGVRILGATDVEIGSPVDTNLFNSVQGCGQYAIRVSDSAQQVNIYQNVTCNSNWGGIALDSVNGYWRTGSQDSLDLDSGPNGWQNTVYTYFGRVTNGKSRIVGWFDGKPLTTYRVDVYVDIERPDSSWFTAQGCHPAGWFTVTTNEMGIAWIDTLYTDPNMVKHGAAFPIVTLTITGTDGTSAFSPPPYAPPGDTTYIDIAVTIDTSRTLVEPNGTAHLYATVSNVGLDPATIIVLHDSLFNNFAIDYSSVTNGTTSVESDVSVAAIPSLLRGEKVEYYAKGRALKMGNHKRSLAVTSRERDSRTRNNSDTISLRVDAINSVDDVENSVIVTTTNNRIFVTGIFRSIAVFDQLGRFVNSGSVEPFTVSCRRGVYLVRIELETGHQYSKIVLVE